MAYEQKAVQVQRNHYPTMRLTSCAPCRWKRWRKKTACCFVGHIPQLPEALRLIKAWGFTFKTVAFVWLKLNRKSPNGFTGWAIGREETRKSACLPSGAIPSVTPKASISLSPGGGTQQKPDITREKIIELAGDLPCANCLPDRKPPAGTWGNEVDSDFSLSVPETR